ncbi:transcriptional-regulating factor 1 isoform X1 [Chiloscyllium plagiosum]|uniref:transcriptional-regulating factor 1 isoform X1 n=1 Tax=Chiloscyllium plagiosum TaxID=36176 RepID=UPI001CB81690|nr:transcriptional-regulating factor 1 isoform X1 [Chiloscyllium plagiosum]XP_043551658.1 transcriptional-regulating factor 1 isoform X1 [Chiloscyllium plagiosum]XP_043551659.1 transcriptional-regulating factor 1 isoform X1 [Chiloscyllium plagiosum]XP_043551660.1 transcriptional-regulating factor 1 isoform X1 [Chiloscyllium plagiosum]XP_043551661.1 transcriptional-regulating factor 1 isoform X1 [Chiloscyllium plagiosum]XP_043551662.1 transcriptional-regulating factor 1 isoform X1 [Chiloscylliu
MMGDQPLYKTNHAVNNTENLYYPQQPQSSPLTNMSGNMNHSYGSTGMDTSQTSPPSPHFPPRSREAAVAGTMPVVTKSLRIEPSHPNNWPHSNAGNHVQMQNDINNSSMIWTSNAQTDVPDGYSYVYSSSANDTTSQKLTSDVLHKLDSFTQVFSNQNLRMQQANNVASSQPSQTAMVENARDSTLRQLLSQKPPAEQQAAVHPMQRFQHSLTQQMHCGFPVAQSKQQLQAIQYQQQQQQQMYFEYQQLPQMPQHQPLLQHQQSHVQQLQAQQVLSQQIQQLPQQQYFVHQQSQQHSSVQQQQQCHMHSVPFCQSQQILCQLQQPMQPQMQPPPPYHGDQNHKTMQQPRQYSQEQSHPSQHIQMAAPSQYFYQDQPHYRQMYQQNQLHQQQEEAMQQKPFCAESRIQASLAHHTSIPASEGAEEVTRKELNKMVHPGGLVVPQRPLIAPSNIPHSVKVSQQQSHNYTWSQISLTDVKPVESTVELSGQNRLPFQERADIKNRLTCTMCHKDFKSLPALNGHMRSHGGQRTSPKQSDEGEKQPKEVDNLMPIIMPVSVPVKLQPAEPSKQATTAKDKPANSVSDDEMPVLMKMTDSPPHAPTVAQPCSSSESIRKCQPSGSQSEDSYRTQRDKKKYRHRPEPLYIPPPSVNLSASYQGATLYQSQLRSPRIMGDHLLDRTHELPPYTPPPMLSPVRQGSGLFSSVISSSYIGTYTALPLTPSTPRILLGRTNSIDALTITPGPGEQTVDIEPRINMGLRFQAAIPVLRERSLVENDISKADLVWKPWCELEDPEMQQKVEDLLNMACSSVVPGGGTNRELALHCLSEAHGNILVAVDILLMKMPIKAKPHPLADYHYAGSDKWTTAERKLFNKALSIHNKDFFLVQKMIKSKTVAQCVEYYYTWKKVLRLGRKHRTRLAEMEAERMFSDQDEELEDEEEEDRKSNHDDNTEVEKSPLPLQMTTVEQPGVQGPTVMCEMPNCGAIFSSRQALNGHARIHGGSSQTPKLTSAAKHKMGGLQSGYTSVKNSPAHNTTSGEIDAATIFPCKECGKMFYKIKSRNAHMKTHRQQEEQQRQKAQKALEVGEIATIAQPATPVAPVLLHPDHMSMVKRHVDLEDNDIIQDLEDVMEESDVMDTDLLLDGDDGEFLQDDDL